MVHADISRQRCADVRRESSNSSCALNIIIFTEAFVEFSFNALHLERNIFAIWSEMLIS